MQAGCTIHGLNISLMIVTQDAGRNVIQNGLKVVRLDFQVDPVLLQISYQPFHVFIKAFKMLFHITDREMEGGIAFLHIRKEEIKNPVGAVYIGNQPEGHQKGQNSDPGSSSSRSPWG